MLKLNELVTVVNKSQRRYFYYCEIKGFKIAFMYENIKVVLTYMILRIILKNDYNNISMI